MTLLQASGVGLSFGGVKALSDVSFSVNRGEIVGLIGPNGAGKTTMLNVISGLLRPHTGDIRFENSAISGVRPHQIARRGIARTFQIVQPFARLTARENVAVATMFSGPSRPPAAEASQIADDALNRVGLTRKADWYPPQLTLSERKRLEVARALAMKPRLLLLDEVMAGLNHTEMGRMIDLVSSINAAGLTVIMVEHVMKAIMAVSHRIIVLQFGRKIADDIPDRVLNDERVIAAYLGDRFVRRLKASGDPSATVIAS